MYDYVAVRMESVHDTSTFPMNLNGTHDSSQDASNAAADAALESYEGYFQRDILMLNFSAQLVLR